MNYGKKYDAGVVVWTKGNDEHVINQAFRDGNKVWFKPGAPGFAVFLVAKGRSRPMPASAIQNWDKWNNEDKSRYSWYQRRTGAEYVKNKSPNYKFVMSVAKSNGRDLKVAGPLIGKNFVRVYRH